MWWIALRPRPDGVQGAAGLPVAVQPRAEACDLWSALAWRCLQYTPWVAVVDGVLVMEVSGSARLFGGQTTLLRQIYMANKPLARMEYAQGATSLVAIGRLLAASPLRTPLALTDLPLPVLAAARPHAELLARMGVRTWGQLRGLPRAGVARRFGQGLLDALDRAWGQAPETHPWLQAPTAFSQRVELGASVDSAPGLLFAARRLLADLLGWLRARQHGVLALALVWELDARRTNTRHRDAHHQGGHSGQLVLRTAAPTQDMAHIQRLLAERLAQVQLPAPVLYLQLHSLQTAPLAGESHSLLVQTLRQGDTLPQTLERLAARLGADQVLGVALCDDHRPERMQQWAPHPGVVVPVAPKKRAADAISFGAAACFGMDSWGVGAALLPPVVWAHPQPLEPRQLHLLGAVQRLEGGWWDGRPVLRDYRLARVDGLGLAWVFCERLRDPGSPPRWFVHGVWG